MNDLDVQVFPDNGIWRKPPGAVQVDVVMQGGDGGMSSDGHEDARGEITTASFPADALPDRVHVDIGRGGRPGGTDGYAMIVTQLSTISAQPEGTL